MVEPPVYGRRQQRLWMRTEEKQPSSGVSSNGMNGRMRGERSRSCTVGEHSVAVSGAIRRKSKCPATLRGKSEEAIW